MLQRKLVSKQSNLTQNVVQGFPQEKYITLLNAVLCDAHLSFGFTYQLSQQSFTLTVLIT